MILLVFATLLFVFLFHHFYWKRRNLPPGPIPLPFIGNLHTLSKHEPGYKAYEMWAHKYGPVYTEWMGPVPFVIISDYELMKETFVRDGDTNADKFQFPSIIAHYREGHYWVVDTNGDIWKENRRFAIHTMRNFGVGKDVMQAKILIEAQEVVKCLLKVDGQEVKINEIWDIAVGSVINQFLFGYRFDDEKVPDFLDFKKLLTDQLLEFSTSQAVFCFMYPASYYIPIVNNIWKKIKFYRNKTYAVFKKEIDNHKKDIDYDLEDSKDYVEAYLKEQNRREQIGDFESFNDMQLINMCLDLWFAGMETTSNTLTWAIAYLLHNIHVQEKLHEELSRVIGSDRDITMADKNDLVYVNAFINETQRIANVVPMNLPHVTTKDTTIKGYLLPKGTGIIHQISTVLYDPKIFPEPQLFKPERFIDENGRLKKIEEFVPFSIGKRQCLGEGLARMELFLLTANFFNKFKVLPGSSGLPSLYKKFATTVHAEPFSCIVQSRH